MAWSLDFVVKNGILRSENTYFGIAPQNTLQ
jgi:hypothetical protein